MGRWLRVGFCVVWLATGCVEVSVPDGLYACGEDDACPPGLTCVAGSCRRPSNDDAGVDAGFVRRDAGPVRVDAGMDAGGPTCGDGFVEGLEECDDENLDSGDGCEDCRTEFGWTCDALGCTPTCGDAMMVGTEACDDGFTDPCGTCNETCTVAGAPSVCGDGDLCAQTEECDDSGTSMVPADGCSGVCAIELGWVCGGTPSTCAMTCGNGVLDPMEDCDDMGLVSADGCSRACRSEVGFDCVGAPSVCMSTCGDGLRASNEGCDDGGLANGDGCNATCVQEPGWMCAGARMTRCDEVCGDNLIVGSEICDDGNAMTEIACPYGMAVCNRCNATCTMALNLIGPYCGNGTVDPSTGETCDDGNMLNSDGCRSTCSVESGWTCPPGGGACSPICGNSQRHGDEVCDDGNISSGDGCSNDCRTVESGYTCTTYCTPICGDLMVRGTEVCDDGDMLSNDGCASNCHAVESGWTCPPTGGECSVRCGDHLVRVPEVCDDGNTVTCGSCNITCTGTQALTAAQGVIVPTGIPIDGQFFTIGDGLMTITFEFDTNSSFIFERVNISSATSTTTVASRIATAITDSALRTTASQSGSMVMLTSETLGTTANVAITSSSSVVFVSGMSGAMGTACGAGIGCAAHSDCASGICSIGGTYTCN